MRKHKNQTGNKLLLLSFLIGVFPIVSQAKYVQTCKVKYEQNDGWSKTYEIQVTFMKGSELNEAIKGYSYSSYASYAIIFWSDEQVSTIKLSQDKCGGLAGSADCDYSDFHSLFDNGYVTGADKEGKEWKVCYNNDCF